LSILGDEGALRRADPSGMLEAFASTSGQLARSYEAARASGIPFAGAVRSVAVCAMGGSAAAGDLVTAAYADRLDGPMVVLRGYRVPGGYGEDDLVLCVSYSGDTEETVAAHGAARQRGARPVAVCGGGELLERAAEADTPAVRILAEAPVPRGGLGALVGGILGAIVAAGVLSDVDRDVEDALSTLEETARELAPSEPEDRNEAKDIAAWVGDRIPLVWGSEGLTGAAAWRWKTAFNENAEIPSFASTLPELDHHEVVGWADGRGAGFCLMVLRDEGEHPTVQARLDATLEEIVGAGLEWREVRSRGRTPIARGMALALVGDLASTYLALLRGVDPAAMDSLTRIKERLAKVRR
jgi:glucose/mannose-6-phosphate isomerase